MTPEEVPKQKDARLPGLARWMVKHSLRTKVREEGLAAFEDEFAERVATTDVSEARSWAYRVAWESLHWAYKPTIEIGMYILTILSVILAVISIL